MFLGLVRLNDPLSSGGKVISVSSTIIIDGLGVALLGDTVICPIPFHGVNKIIQGSTEWISDGKPVVVHKCMCQCGCYVISTLPCSGIW